MRALAVAVLLMALSPPARAQDAFEIQVYDAETAPPGNVGFELHVNSSVSGTRTPSSEGELPTHEVTRLALEPHVGLAPWCEAGGYLQAAVRPDGQFDYAGIKLRFKMRIPHRVRELFGFALNLELSSVPQTYEATGLASELRPIFDVTWRRLYLSINPIVGFDFFGRYAGHPQLEPAAAAMVRVVGAWNLGLEYYGAYGPIDHPFPVADQVHRLFVVSTLEWRWFGLHVGAGHGFTAGDAWIVKMIVGVDLGGGTRSSGG